MHFAVIARILGIFLMLFSMTMLPPILVSMWFNDGATEAFVIALVLTFGLGFVSWLPVKNAHNELRTRDGFLIAALFWLTLGLAGTLPFMIAEHPGLSFADAFFESLSGWTTTGATVMTGLEYLPKSILWYRQQLQWLGGMGIIVLAVAILPMLGIGGMQLYRAEMPGPLKDSKLTPRIAETAKALWYVYAFLTISCALAYWFAGMSGFDAVTHSFATVGIGGFSTYDASIGHFNSALIEGICVFFMLIAAMNYSLHFFAWRNRTLSHYLQDSEIRFFLLVMAGGILLTISALWLTDTYPLPEAIRFGVFELVSIATTAGFGTADFAGWPVFLPVLLFMMAFIGGCTGSTGGGMKVIRVLLIYKQGVREIRRLIHPNAVMPVKLGRRAVPDRILDAVWGFFAVYIVTFMVMMLALMATGLDQVTAFSAVGSCLNNLGPGLGDVAAHYGNISDTAKWLLALTMLLGRLEIFTLLVLLSPNFWRS
ncbi:MULTISPECIES: TrkH family potassium uptake protein [unclassified Thalassolituus]|jgi:trk system potassium uptake protein TrkH|uniref:TrkH family potassium uptake protein n=1 Tax=Oceanospirillaceae TaxID=135620 RepID=UPI001190BF0A|nr:MULTISPECIES: TrkH family potassium uptake protein [unclassified Thalassolituus]MCA6059040.1 potassium transporter [Thalassolituus sp. ST750PaO-4]TVV44611.1 potassium transporter [Thalassolituus sp. C2-1]